MVDLISLVGGLAPYWFVAHGFMLFAGAFYPDMLSWSCETKTT